MEIDVSAITRNEVEKVKSQLNMWQDYHNGRSNLQPKAYSDSDRVAQAIYEHRKIRAINSDLDLSVSNTQIQNSLDKAKAGDKYFFLKY